jgi:hypothetical protein
MFLCKSKLPCKIIILALLSFFFVIGSCKNLSGSKDNNADTDKKAVTKKEAAKKTTAEDKPENKSVKENPQDVPEDGFIRLVLNEKKGCFSLFYLTDPQNLRYEPLFNSRNSSASSLSVLVDDNIYKLGNSKKFKTRIERDKKDTSFIFESPFLKITQVFSPVKTTSSSAANGVKITITVQNTATQRSFVGLRMLLDTELGEKKVPFLTNTQVVSSELQIDGHSNEKYWISRGKKISLMGSIVNPINGVGKGPDIVHIANWKRLKDTPWRLKYLQGRSFSNLPNSVGDSAVCYYFGPEMLDLNKTLTYTVFLTTEDVAWYNNPADKINTTVSSASSTQDTSARQPSVQPAKETLFINIPAIEAQAREEAAATNENADIIFLTKLQDILNQFINGQILLRENDLFEIEKTIEKYKIRD